MSLSKISEKISLKSEFRALGTDVFLELVLPRGKNPERARGNLEEVKKIFFAKEKVFSRFRLDSELSGLNRNLGVFQKASPDILYISRRALCYNKLSSGLYDPRVIEILEKIGYDQDFRSSDFSKKRNDGKFSAIENNLGKDLKIKKNKVFFGRRMDFSGIAKGYIVDYAARFLVCKGWENFLVDAGGDMNIFGLNREGKEMADCH